MATVGRIAQTFRRVCLRRRLVDDPSYAHLHQREHAHLKSTGFAHNRAVSKRKGLSPTDVKNRVSSALHKYEYETSSAAVKAADQ